MNVSESRNAERILWPYWKEMWKDLGAKGDLKPKFDALLYSYDDPDRIHHGVPHLLFYFNELSPYLSKLKSPAVTIATAFYHDSEMQTRLEREGLNEKDSASRAEKELSEVGICTDAIAQIKAGIEASNHKGNPPDDSDIKYGLDADMAIIGKPRKRFLEYEKGIRGEFFWLAETKYRKGRSGFLKGLDERQIFLTDDFAAQYEKISKENANYLRNYLDSGQPLLTPFRHVAVYPGSFDPVTIGHEHIAKRAAQQFDLVVVAIGTDTGKNPMFTQKERYQMLKAVFRNVRNIRADYYGMQMTAFYAQEIGAGAMVRGVRNEKDSQAEDNIAQINIILDPNLDTLLINSPDHLSRISSSMVKQVINYKDWPLVYERWEEAAAHFVSPCVVDMLTQAHQKSLASK